MNSENHIRLTPRMHKAIDELKGLITARFPQAEFVVEEGFDPEGVYLITTVDKYLSIIILIRSGTHSPPMLIFPQE